ncbi:unnamed protein product [Brassica oleracea var. botrytis]|uniref:Uncharacterized protein n=2 Tax=Brassica TaxID=3705 RepID=A0A3P6E2G3_BRAOL|nr:unnamed protein product [Brassica napus]VDD34330.1 unnamed protein product [Brassica oleracea]
MAEEISFNRLNSPPGRQGGAEERWSRGGSVVSELRRNSETVEGSVAVRGWGVQVEAGDAWWADEQDSYTCLFPCLLGARLGQARPSIVQWAFWICNMVYSGFGRGLGPLDQ